MNVSCLGLIKDIIFGGFRQTPTINAQLDTVLSEPCHLSRHACGWTDNKHAECDSSARVPELCRMLRVRDEVCFCHWHSICFTSTRNL